MYFFARQSCSMVAELTCILARCVQKAVPHFACAFASEDGAAAAHVPYSDRRCAVNGWHRQLGGIYETCWLNSGLLGGLPSCVLVSCSVAPAGNWQPAAPRWMAFGDLLLRVFDGWPL